MIQLNSVASNMYDIQNHNYRPLPEGLEIRNSSIHGQGVFTKVLIHSGEMLGETHHLHDELIRTPLGGFLNHSEDSNCEILVVNKTWYLMTSREILPDEELTLNYQTCLSYLDPFKRVQARG